MANTNDYRITDLGLECNDCEWGGATLAQFYAHFDAHHVQQSVPFDSVQDDVGVNDEPNASIS